ncbi:DUF1707 domain-containing protein [Lipingzhangella sp. LS1_29]|uniref:DUF1707 domain-containing protein n=1 Tax=Lipingzhangella rawalii TaxID=2055835 RepID=A0ABU2HA06_9ACTN|nr:DUF1707 domain-containing protein [Lipingzhangella rawalii]MDS1272137.1 DUF1707 domain-containing protein [Lipingzhangella rawalii]
MSEGVPPPRMRAGDADRERVLAVLRDAATDGRIDLDEHNERAERVHTARTLGELVSVTEDLLPPAEQPIQLRSEPVIALFRGERRAGRWVVPARHVSFALGTTVELDLREALMVRRHVRMHASAILGRVVVHLPDEVEVRIRGWAFLGRRHTNTRPPRSDDPPILELEGFCLLGSLRVRSPRRRWSLWRRRRRELE